jgi:hypothetical protein
MEQYRNITTKSIFQDRIGFIYETPLFHKTRRAGAAGKRRAGTNPGLNRALQGMVGEEAGGSPASSLVALTVRLPAPAGVRGFFRGH